LADFLWKWAPDGNPRQQNFKFQAEYVQRSDQGWLNYDVNAVNQGGHYQGKQSGYYLQSVYQFHPNWRIGYRFDRLAALHSTFGAGLTSSQFPILQPYSPQRNTLMVDFNPSEFSRIRLQYAQDRSRPDFTDQQWWLQYIVSLGTHGAHQF
jgi:hypothetical protein